MAEIHAQFGVTIFNRSGQSGTKTTSLLALLLRAQTVFVDQHLKFADLTFLCGILLKEGYLYSESIICLDLAYDTYQKILEPSSLRLGESLLEKGRVCFELKEYMDASLFLEKVRTLWTDSSSPKSSNKVVEVTRLLGFCAHKLGQTEKSLEYLKQVASKRKKLPRKSLYYHEDTNALFAMGILRHEQNEIGSALDLYKRCHQLFKSVNCGKSRQSMLEVAIAAGNAYLKGGSPFRALMSFEQALFDAKGMGNILLECESLSSMVS
jgi:tetratricopeptide (TPR) repeat protein